ncbi:AAA family ATPase [Microbulbifer sp. OS29]|uniref:AAA family ATPase n=1 Tax=Microbulbifer okhotskensis TaxID=2926617 RepID=A0A9X2J6Q5_9GAMM|nr:AAA family ATPase [Microbulbifer okhotskensis]MCO1336493.1 AAA family ATPase [Microbulbifer okhotskensis]
MKKVVIFGNSGAGKSTLSKELSESEGLRHFDLDTVAWKPVSPPERKPVDKSRKEINKFLGINEGWVIEGCYSDLLEIVLPVSSEIVFLNLPVETCISNAKNRPWEPHKYASKEAQDKNLNMLIDWISEYPVRDDTFSKSSHEALYYHFIGKKIMYTDNKRHR